MPLFLCQNGIFFFFLISLTPQNHISPVHYPSLSLPLLISQTWNNYAVGNIPTFYPVLLSFIPHFIPRSNPGAASDPALGIACDYKNSFTYPRTFLSINAYLFHFDYFMTTTHTTIIDSFVPPLKSQTCAYLELWVALSALGTFFFFLKKWGLEGPWSKIHCAEMWT